eukprot:364349-Chlamydomonas_euryale.AAC.16
MLFSFTAGVRNAVVTRSPTGGLAGRWLAMHIRTHEVWGSLCAVLRIFCGGPYCTVAHMKREARSARSHTSFMAAHTAQSHA